MKKKIKLNKKYIIITFIILVSLLFIYKINYNYKYKPYKIDKDYSKLDLKGYDKLMIVAHPDDELLWGGSHLLESKYLVVCITCGPDKERGNEFSSVMNETGDKFIMLGYPDVVNLRRDNWETSKDDITKDLNAIINLKEWDLVVTHNPDGEYGHIHHKITNQIVTDLFEDKDKLYYFGNYYTKRAFHKHYDKMLPLTDLQLKKKTRLIGLYKSQIFIQTSFNHMFEFEDWENYYEWGDLNEKEN